MSLKKIIYLILVFTTVLSIASCTLGKQEQSIELYQDYNKKTGVISGKLEHLQTSVPAYIVFKYGKPFESNVISMHIDIPGITDEHIYESSVVIDPKEEVVAFRVSIKKEAKYEILFYFSDIDKPIAEGEILVIDPK